MKATIQIRLAETVADVSGETLKERLNAIGFTEVKEAKIGKLIELELESADVEGMNSRVEQMCRRLFVNSEIEVFELQITE